MNSGLLREHAELQAISLHVHFLLNWASAFLLGLIEGSPNYGSVSANGYVAVKHGCVSMIHARSCDREFLKMLRALISGQTKSAHCREPCGVSKGVNDIQFVARDD